MVGFGFLKKIASGVAKLFIKKGAKRTTQEAVKKGIKSGGKIVGKFDESIPMGFKPIKEIPKVGIPKQTLTKAQRLAASKADISKLGGKFKPPAPKADISKLGGKFKPPAPNPQRMTNRIARLTAKNKLTPAQEALRTTTQARKALGATIKPAVQPTLPAVSNGLSTGKKLGVAGVAGAGGIGIGVGINKKKKKKRN